MIKHRHIPIASRVFYQAILDEIKRVDHENNWKANINTLHEIYIKRVEYYNALINLKAQYEKKDE